ncbi:putative primosomal protein N' [Actinomycetes bacterium]|nr:putative primosomal protein N' [Actinomycetes bacterium]
MAQLRPLRLISQRAKSNYEAATKGTFVVDVVVDTPVIHLDGLYTYALTDSDRELCEIGAFVKIPFGKTVTTGYVVNIRVRTINDVALKSIVSIITNRALLQPNIWALIQIAATRYCTNPNELIRFAIPPRVANSEKISLTFPKKAIGSKSPPYVSTGLLKEVYGSKISAITSKKSGAILAPTAIDTFEILLEMILQKISLGPVLVIVPDAKDTDRLVGKLSEHGQLDFLRFDSSLDKSARYLAFLRILQGEYQLVIGNRSAIFAPIPNLQSIIILNESDPSNFERRSPYTNTRDLALLRSNNEKISLWFLDASPSLELLRLVESKWLPFFTPSVDFVRDRKWLITSENHELTRKNVFSVIRHGLERGPVLIVVSERGYFNAATCNQCKNQALCKCGAKLLLGKAATSPECVLCATKYPEWKCNWCNSTKFYRFQKGDERHLEEFGKAFPKVSITSSNAKLAKVRISNESAIVIATPGCEPVCQDGYAAIVLLDGKSIFNRPFLRSEEEARYRWLNALTMLRPDGQIYLSLPDSHPEVQALLQPIPLKSSRSELENRKGLSFPPYARFIEIQSASKEINLIAEQLRREDSINCEVLGPTQIDKLESKIILKVSIADSAKLGKIVYDLKRYRSAKAMSALRVQVDPFTI